MVNSTMLDLGSNRSVIRELFEYGKKRAAECGAENVFDYSLGNPSIPSPAEVNENAVRIMRERSSIAVHGYTSAVGDNGVRTAIADDLNARFGTSYKKENLFMTCGAAASLISVFRALTVDHSSEILAIAPFFPEYECFVKANGGVFGYVPADVPSFQIDFKKLEAMISENTQAVIINSPNNPSGVVYSEETVARLADLLTQKSARFGHPIYIISDEPYRELVYGSATVPWVPSFYKNTIVCYSYSKSLSLPGERIGYVLVRMRRLHRRLQRRRRRRESERLRLRPVALAVHGRGLRLVAPGYRRLRREPPSALRRAHRDRLQIRPASRRVLPLHRIADWRRRVVQRDSDEAQPASRPRQRL